MEVRNPPNASMSEKLVYSPLARGLHWLTVLFVAVLIPVGLYMTWRGDATQFDATTNALYSAHKLFGFVLLCLVAIRLVYRLTHGAPPDEPTLEWWQKAGAHLTHWGLYGLLFAVPLLGWLGVTHYGALGTLGGLKLPAIPGQHVLYDATSSVASLLGFKPPPATADGPAKAELVFALHFWAAMLMLLALGAHIGAAIYHHFIRRDGVLRRMLPGLKQRS
ncbi:MAG: cytochrome b [Hyphomicrobiaceae bacterium]